MIEGGSITVGDLMLHECDDEHLALYRNTSIGFIFQYHFLLSSLKAIDNIYLPARIGTGLTRGDQKSGFPYGQLPRCRALS